MNDSTTKRCSKCGQVKPIAEFGKYAKAKDGLKSWCKACSSEDSKRWYRENAEKHYEAVKHWRAEHPDESRAIDERFRQNHPERVRRKVRRWRIANIDRAREATRQWQIEHPEWARRNEHQRRAKKQALPSTFTDHDWQRALDYFHGCCAYCSNPPSLFDYYPTLQQDHYIPLTQGGSYTPDNIIPACQTCNKSKLNRNAANWIIERFGTKRGKAILSRIQAYFEWVKALPS